MEKTVCGYHAECTDGFGAGWAVRDVLGDTDVEFYPCIYQKEPPDWTGRDVILVDFCYKRPVIDRIIAQCSSLLILDHHKTAAEDLAGLPPAGVSFHEWRQTLLGSKPIGVLFDMNRSGAGIAWDFFHNLAHTGERRPEFIDYIEDRDLWRKRLPEGDQFTIALRSYAQDFEIWDALIARGVPALIQEGRGIWRYYQERIKEMRKSAYLAEILVMEPVDVDGREVPVSHRCLIANAPYFAASELVGDMAAEEGPHDFGACYFEVRPGEWQYSLRSRGSYDVADLARKFGGGGHKGAAGFTAGEPVHRHVLLPEDEAVGAGSMK